MIYHLHNIKIEILFFIYLYIIFTHKTLRLHSDKSLSQKLDFNMDNFIYSLNKPTQKRCVSIILTSHYLFHYIYGNSLINDTENILDLSFINEPEKKTNDSTDIFQIYNYFNNIIQEYYF